MQANKAKRVSPNLSYVYMDKPFYFTYINSRGKSSLFRQKTRAATGIALTGVIQTPAH